MADPDDLTAITVGQSESAVEPEVTYALLDQASLQRCRLDQSQPRTWHATHSLGRLRALPNELIDAVLLHLDIKTLTDWRSVNKAALKHLDAHHEYAAIVRHASDVLRAILSLETGRNIRLRELWLTLHEARCRHHATCGNAGECISLFRGCHRVCLQCLHSREHPEYQMIPDHPRLLARFHVTADTLRAMPQFRSMPGDYGILTRPHLRFMTARHRYFDFVTLLEELNTEHRRSWRRLFWPRARLSRYLSVMCAACL